MRLDGQVALITGASRGLGLAIARRSSAGAGSEERDRTLEPAEVASLVAFVCAAPEHVAVGDVAIWPLSAGVASQG